MLKERCVLLARQVNWAWHTDQQYPLWPTSPISMYIRYQPQPVDGATLHQLLGKAESLSPAERHLLARTQSHLWLPLVAERVLGLLIVAPKRGSEYFNHTDRAILEVVARQASIALHNAQLTATLRQRAQDIERLHRELLRAREAERAKVAYDLHDEVVQGLLGLKYRIERLTAEEVVASEHAADLLDDVLGMAHLVRHICADLRPPTLDTLGVVGAVRTLVRTVQRRATFHIQLLVEGDETIPVPDELAICLYRFIQEALHNTEKHAAAEQVHIHVVLQPGSVCVTITDDGRGFRMPSHDQLLDAQHYGLVGLHERVTLLKGSFEVVSAPEQGTCLRAALPLVPSATRGNEENLDHDTTAQSVE